MLSRSRCAWTTALVLALACDKPAQPTTRPTPQASAETGSRADEPGARADPEAWWLADDPCPLQSRLLGAPFPRGTRIWCETAEGVADGRVTVWHENGNKKAEGTWRAGEQDGQWTTWYPDGTKKTQGRYVQGSMVGQWTSWGPDGSRVTQVLHGDDGQAHYRSWRSDGSLHREGTYVDGREHGTWTDWGPDGRVQRRRTYELGDAVTPEPFPTIGVPACDAFVSRYLRCVQTQLQGEAREQARAAMKASLRAWHDADDDPTLAQRCEQAEADVRDEMSGAGCEL